MRDIDSFDTYLESYTIDYVPLIDLHIGQTAKHKEAFLQPGDKQDNDYSQSNKKEPEASSSGLFSNLFGFSRSNNNESS